MALRLLVAVAAVALAPLAAARIADTVSTATASGAGGVATVSAGASHPRYLTVSVAASPTQLIQVTWSVRCSNGLSAGSKAGRRTAVAPFIRRFTFSASSPASCTARASAQLRHDGKLTVKIARGS